MNLLRLNKILSEKGVSSKELAEKANVSQNTISNIANGHNFPKPELLKSIAEILNVDIRELFHQTKLPQYDQIKHEQLVKIVNVIEGKDMFKIKEETISITELKDISEINRGIKLMLDALNVRSGSNGEYDVYKLLSIYLTNTSARKEITAVMDNY